MAIISAFKSKEIQIIPDNYRHPSKTRKADIKFIDRQMKVPGYKYELGAFYFITNDPRTQWN